jgi:hypothetical protein
MNLASKREQQYIIDIPSREGNKRGRVSDEGRRR